MIWLYRLIVFHVILLAQLLRPFLNGKIRLVIEEKNLQRFRSKNNSSAPNSPIWIHAASGEIEYAKPLIRKIKEHEPHLQILLTFTSPSAIPLIEKIEEVSFWGPLPWDTPSEMKDFLNTWKPRLLLIARTDAWPEMIQQTSQLKIPTYLFAATFADNSSRLKWPVSLWTQSTLKQLTGIFVVSEYDLKNLKSLPGDWPQAEVLGDTRFDQVFYRLALPPKISENIKPHLKTLLLGSTWPEDEAQLMPEISQLLKMNLQIMIAPHEIHHKHVLELWTSLSALGYKVHRLSEASSNDWDLLIVDQLGVLAELYLWADYAFIGGSFKKQVHSVMEALAAGCHVFVGPYHKNNREALEFQKIKPRDDIPAVRSIQSGSELTSSLLLLKDTDLKPWREALISEIKKHQGSSERLISRIPRSLWQ